MEVKVSVYSDFCFEVDEFGLTDFINVEKEVNLDRVVAIIKSWDVSLLSAVSDFKWISSPKFYDYLFVRKPILAVSDNGELNLLMVETESGQWANTNQE